MTSNINYVIDSISAVPAKGSVVLNLDKKSLIPSLNACHKLYFNCLIDIVCVDYPDRPERFELTYILLSVSSNRRVFVRINVDSGVHVDSITGIFVSAGWLEREVYDMYGVVFHGNSDLRRILTDYDFKHHPMLKNFPLSGYEEVRYDDERGEVVYSPVDLVQEYRNFDFLRPWDGTKYIDSE